MGAIADGIAAYAQSLIDQTDGSLEQMNKALALSQLCFNLALSPEDSRERQLRELQPRLQMDDEEFDDFRRSIITPMIERHRDMFPRMHQPLSTATLQSDLPQREYPGMAAPAETSPVPDRYAPCPCNSGEKYKFCCGKKRR